MLKSLWRYTRYFSVTFFARKERTLLFRNTGAFYGGGYQKKKFSLPQKTEAMHKAARWLAHNQQHQADKGFSTYYIAEGHTSSYPETSGYIIDSLFAYSGKYKAGLEAQLLQCADWLLKIQKASGGWQAGYVADNKPEVVFNTGQVMRGLLAAYKTMQDERYLQACRRAGDWLAAIQEMDGSWQAYASMNVKRTYDSYVSAPLVQLYLATREESYRLAAEKNCYWIIDTQQQPNGWFANADNTIAYNDRPILHTIAYTIDGLLDCGLMLQNDVFVTSAKKAADELLKLFRQQGALSGRYDKHWHASQYMICTGCAQISIVWSKLYKHTKQEVYRAAASDMNSQLLAIQALTNGLGPDVEGALQGSFPLWGKYEPFAFPNWATKYLLDALMYETGS